jgi:hypothetical protein
MDYPKRISLRIKFDSDTGVMVMRPGPYGNPFRIPIDGNRDEVINKFETYLLNNEELLKRVKKELRGQNLICICGPKQRCHADVLIKIANQEVLDF